MVSRRPGHSLPEVIVALTVMGATLAAVTSASVLGARWTVDAVVRQEATSAAVAALDSLLALPTTPRGGSAPLAPLPFELAWNVPAPEAGAGMGAVVTVHVVREGGRSAADTVARISGLWIPPLPPLEP